jgi:hypothetical protein
MVLEHAAQHGAAAAAAAVSLPSLALRPLCALRTLCALSFTGYCAWCSQIRQFAALACAKPKQATSRQGHTPARNACNGRALQIFSVAARPAAAALRRIQSPRSCD